MVTKSNFKVAVKMEGEGHVDRYHGDIHSNDKD
jgi:hypothetical protein